jgi:hypothetical protein
MKRKGVSASAAPFLEDRGVGVLFFSLVHFSSSSVQKRGFRYGSSTILADFYHPLALRDYPAIFKLPWSFEEKSEK